MEGNTSCTVVDKKIDKEHLEKVTVSFIQPFLECFLFERNFFFTSYVGWYVSTHEPTIFIMHTHV